MTTPDLHLDPTYGPWLQLAVIFAATFASEDLTCVGVGLLVRAGEVNLSVGLLGCFAGIFVGDLGLWVVGRLIGSGLLRWGWLAGKAPRRRLAGMGQWFDRRGWAAILAARFMPGTRVPLYVGAGMLRHRAGHFVLWTALAALLWTPLMVLLAATLGDAVAVPFDFVFGSGWPAVLLALVALCLLLRAAALAATPVGRGKLVATLSRLWRWEFWPSWLLYLPLLPWLAYLSVRHRGALVWTAANPGIMNGGGIVGESKFAILERLPPERVAQAVLLEPGPTGDRMGQLLRGMSAKCLGFPLVLKPDAAERGASVRKVNDLAAAEAYLAANPAPAVAQAYHPGPYEVGIYYYRLPGEQAGRIFSVTDKVFPVLVGDGRSTLEELIWRHPRYRMQAAVFLKRHERLRDAVLADGERLPLALAGNHCQGTLFRDGSGLITPELERAVDEIAKRFDGFFVGRFDVRYSDAEAFAAGRDLAVVELNGVTAESTNLYDPSWTLLMAYRTLFRQWSLLYRIGHANRRRGHGPITALALARLLLGYCRGTVDPLGD